MPSTNTLHVRCVACQHWTARIRREDGTFGSCHRCGGSLVRETVWADRRIQRAKADLEALHGTARTR